MCKCDLKWLTPPKKEGGSGWICSVVFNVPWKSETTAEIVYAN